jgi:phosphoglycolate phosphatase-like HAD superfamily hydrolase
MATTSDAAKTTAKEATPAEAPAFYLAVLLEDGLVKGHAAAFETVRECLPDSKKKAWTPVLFMRCKGDALAPEFVARAAEALELEPAETEMLKSRFAEAFPKRVIEEASDKLGPGLMSWMEEAKRRKGALLVLSTLSDETADAVSAKMRLDQVGFERGVLPNNASMPLAKRLVRLARKLKVAPSKMMMIATGAVAARAALEAGFQCVAIPDELTSHADYSGCQFVMEQYGDISAGELFDTLFPKTLASSKR